MLLLQVGLGFTASLSDRCAHPGRTGVGCAIRRARRTARPECNGLTAIATANLAPYEWLRYGDRPVTLLGKWRNGRLGTLKFGIWMMLLHCFFYLVGSAFCNVYQYKNLAGLDGVVEFLDV